MTFPNGVVHAAAICTKVVVRQWSRLQQFHICPDLSGLPNETRCRSGMQVQDNWHLPICALSNLVGLFVCALHTSAASPLLINGI